MHSCVQRSTETSDTSSAEPVAVSMNCVDCIVGDGLSLPSLPRLQDYIQDLGNERGHRIHFWLHAVASVERTEFLCSAKDNEAYEGVLWGLAGAAHSKNFIRGRTTLSLL